MILRIALWIGIAVVALALGSYLIGRGSIHIETRTKIRAARSRVFAALTEPELLVRWIGGLQSDTALTEGGLRLGARSRQVIVEHGRRIESESTVTALDRDRLLKVAIVGPGFRGELEYRLEERASETELVHTEHMRMSGIAAVLAPWIRGALRRKLEGDLERLKALVEAH